jgi:2-keto-4-pentenoate hydratase
MAWSVQSGRPGRLLQVGLLLACVGSTPGVLAAAADDPGVDAGLARRIATAAFLGAPYPDIDDALTPAQAYALQARVVAEGVRRSPVAGFKAGLTDAPARQRFGASEPVSGALLASGRLGNRSNITLDADDRVMIEIEIGFVLARPVTAPLGDDDDPLAFVAAIVPVVELPNLNLHLGPAGQPSVADIVGSNVSAQQYMVGDARQVPSASVLEAITVRLARDDLQLAAGSARAAQGSQVAALRWLVNHRLARGDTLAAGQLLITGALAGMTPAAPGRHRAFFGPLGSVEFRIFSADAPPRRDASVGEGPQRAR